MEDSGVKLGYFVQKCKELSEKINAKQAEAEKYFNSGEIVQGVKKVRVMLTLCPANQFAAGKLVELKDKIGKQSQSLYSTGLEQYANGNIVEAIGSWEKVIELSPDTATAKSARDNIENAKKKVEGLKKFKK
jgi:tetratricopeptide (TPR) repeat protein